MGVLSRAKAKKEQLNQPSPPEFRTNIDHVDNVMIVFQLSDAVVKLLS